MNYSVIFGVCKELLVPQLFVLGIIGPLDQFVGTMVKVAMANAMVSFLVYI